MLKDPLLEKRAREISKGLRCLVCQNQSIDDSDADLAKDLRVIVRERLKAGDSDGDVVEFVVARYGDFVLLKPPFKGATLVLWIGPALIALGGIAAMIAYLRRNRRSAAGGGAAKAAPLTADEQRRLAKLMKDGAP
ncbi:MAG: cytochrome c-type biogenesis protein CcmH [Rhodospirillales bacterium]|nr:cytochrome c-type biogenesis protein CcmH [Rhodospirillales bacterium]